MSGANTEMTVELANGIKIKPGVVLDGPAVIEKDGVEHFAGIFSITRWNELFHCLARHVAEGKSPNAEELISFVSREVERCGVEWTPEVAAAVIYAVSRAICTPMIVLDNYMTRLVKSFGGYLATLEVADLLDFSDVRVN